MTSPDTQQTEPFHARVAAAVEAVERVDTATEAHELAVVVGALGKEAERDAKGQRTPLVKSLGAAAVTLRRLGVHEDLRRGLDFAVRYLRAAEADVPA